ncbi:hypothetical protein V1515DRAFT_246388 [Lipomyces mesembrius]
MQTRNSRSLVHENNIKSQLSIIMCSNSVCRSQLFSTICTRYYNIRPRLRSSSKSLRFWLDHKSSKHYLKTQLYLLIDTLAPDKGHICIETAKKVIVCLLHFDTLLQLSKMAGDHHQPKMRENYEAHFRWTPRTSRHAILFLCVIPGVLLWTAYRFEGKINFEAKKRGDSIWEK